MVLDERGIRSTVVVMGSARVRADGTGAAGGLARWYEEARKLAYLITEESLKSYGREFVVVTGGGPGIMEAGNLGAAEAGGQSIGLNIVLPHEQAPNPHVTPDLCFNFHYFAIRKMHFLMRARAVCIFPGGFGTLDEMFEALTLIQTGRMKPVPFLLFGRAFWEKIVDWQALADEGLIAQADLSLFRFVETAEEAVEVILGWETPA
jgi:uncharacterized protein (TIGR00730 family)